MLKNMQVQIEIRDAIGYLRLDRTKTINALTTKMLNAVSETLDAWANNPQIQEVHISGLGERGYSAGADIRSLYDLAMAGDLVGVFDFLEYEYRVDAQVADFPKPITTLLHGVSMGGGLGLGTHRGDAGGKIIAKPNLKWAMPEVGIGLWPDVGMSYQLARTPGQIGSYLAMTGAAIDAPSALYAGLIDEIDYCDEPSSNQAASNVQDANNSPNTQISWLEQNRSWIDASFNFDDPLAIVEALKNAKEPAAGQCAKLIESRNPISVFLGLACVRRAAKATSVNQVLAQDLALARTLPANMADFVEGVRAQLVDKDRNPRWSLPNLAAVNPDDIQARFQG